ncbi:unnamed protein product [Lepeophtheirus salmonis]|uniref:(salmon louse) hypothetical protein n=1 Tax=Lepeophtheirus salmonis TaxID=72036 RepID=A0A7R8CFJ2_LEPSM|nr:unnamed protein product [Lepeophtheirus salmonis]CAF2802636.1 unnamed protein product [Lepeophtheirus salmonis]
MRSLTTRGGLTRERGMTENVVQTWVHTMHVYTSIHGATTTLTWNTHKTRNQHAELGKSCIKRDNDDLEKIRAWIESHNPFDKNEPILKKSVGETIQHQLKRISYSESQIKKKDRIKTLEALEVGATCTDRERRGYKKLFPARAQSRTHLTILEFDNVQIKQSKTGTCFIERCLSVHLQSGSIIQCSGWRYSVT